LTSLVRRGPGGEEGVKGDIDQPKCRSSDLTREEIGPRGLLQSRFRLLQCSVERGFWRRGLLHGSRLSFHHLDSTLQLVEFPLFFGIAAAKLLDLSLQGLELGILDLSQCDVRSGGQCCHEGQHDQAPKSQIGE
jgi:hypothetical protein